MFTIRRLSSACLLVAALVQGGPAFANAPDSIGALLAQSAAASASSEIEVAFDAVGLAEFAPMVTRAALAGKSGRAAEFEIDVDDALRHASVVEAPGLSAPHPVDPAVAFRELKPAPEPDRRAAFGTSPADSVPVILAGLGCFLLLLSPQRDAPRPNRRARRAGRRQGDDPRLA